jgi:hypothetical protein
MAAASGCPVAAGDGGCALPPAGNAVPDFKDFAVLGVGVPSVF